MIGERRPESWKLLLATRHQPFECYIWRVPPRMRLLLWGRHSPCTNPRPEAASTARLRLIPYCPPSSLPHPARVPWAFAWIPINGQSRSNPSPPQQP